MVTKKLTTAPLERKLAIEKRRLSNRRRGLDFAWPNLNELASLKKGYPIVIAGEGGVGKTELILDIMINASLMHKWVWIVMSPEMGDRDEIIEQLIEKVSKGQIVDILSPSEEADPNHLPMSNDTFNNCINWINKYFRILDPMENWTENFENLNLNLKNFFEQVGEEENRLGKKFDGVCIDPFNELDIDWSNIMNAVKEELNVLIAWTKKKDYCTLLTNHVKDKREITSKDNDNELFFWTPPTKKEELAYGQQFDRKGYQIILVYNPHKTHQTMGAQSGDIEMKHSVENYNNVREVIVQKSKPKGSGKTGKCRMFFDRNLNRYYSLDLLNETKKGILWPKV
jgi:hypothetical protein